MGAGSNLAAASSSRSIASCTAGSHSNAMLWQWLMPSLRSTSATARESSRWRRCVGHRADVVVGAPPGLSDYTFTRESGEAILARHFHSVVRTDVDAHVVFPNARAVADYVAASLGRDHLAGRLPRDLGPFRVRTAQAVFIASR